MQKQDDMIAEKTVKEECQESQENQTEQNFEKIMPLTKTEWYIRDILSTIDRLQEVLSQEDLWRDQAVNMCDRIRRAAEKLEQHVLYPTETKNNFEGGTDMSEIIKPEEMCVIRREEASEAEDLTDQEPAKEETEDPEYQHIYMKLPDGKTCRVHTSTDIRKFVYKINCIYMAILTLEEFIAMTTENMISIADYLNDIKRVNKELLEYLDE